MYIVYYMLGKEACVKHFNVKHEAIDFAEMQDNATKIIHCDPTNPEPIVIKWKKARRQVSILNDGTLEVIKDEPLVMPAEYMPEIPRNEYELILEDALTKLYGLVRGLAEQLKRLSN